MRIAVYGVGGAAGYFGGRLAQAGEEVVFVARGEHLEAIRSGGLRVDSDRGDFIARPAVVTDDVTDHGPIDVAILGVKSWQVHDAAEQLDRVLTGEQAFALPLQNGIAPVRQLTEVLGASRVMAGLCRVNSTRVGPGQIRQAGVEPTIIFGELDNQDTERARRLAAAFGRAGIAVERPADIHVNLWQKFLLVAGWGAVAGVARAPIGVLRELPETRELMRLALGEVHAVAKAEGIGLPHDAADAMLRYIDTLPPQLTISLQRDIADGLPTEIDDWCGTVVRLSRKHDLEAPIMAFAANALAALEARARGKVDFTPT